LRKIRKIGQRKKPVENNRLKELMVQALVSILVGIVLLIIEHLFFK